MFTIADVLAYKRANPRPKPKGQPAKIYCVLVREEVNEIDEPLRGMRFEFHVDDSGRAMAQAFIDMAVQLLDSIPGMVITHDPPVWWSQSYDAQIWCNDHEIRGVNLYTWVLNDNNYTWKGENL